ncbi:MAG TPA: hypothetical protein VJP79_03505 [Nitrososphaera sp.]|nr:hypothetical protein [Nitrososphaera sp.]
MSSNIPPPDFDLEKDRPEVTEVVTGWDNILKRHIENWSQAHSIRSMHASTPTRLQTSQTPHQ